jgi:RND superfamily putative drug exporter
MVILSLTFGTIVAMLLPILNAILALLATLAIVRLLGHVTSVPTVAPTLATMIGLGVGIDYALFIVTRHFRGMKEGLALEESIARAVATSGGAVFFAGGTVTIALVSLAVAGIPLVTTMGLMAGVAVVVAVLAALTLMPAALALAGPRINSLRVRAVHPESAKEGLWAKWANDIAKRPLLAGLLALAILLPLTIPLLSLTLGQQDVAALSSTTTARRAYDLISKNFGPGVNGPLLVAVSLGSPAKLRRRRASRRSRRYRSIRRARSRTSTRSPLRDRRRKQQRTSSNDCARVRFRPRRRVRTCMRTSAAAPPATSTWRRRSRASCRCRSSS